MPFTYALGRTRTSAAGNPTTFSYTVATGDSVVAVMLNTQSGTNRAGGALTWGSTTLTQANSTQKAAASPEASCELWYMLNPTPATSTLTIPNTNAATIFTTVVIGRAPQNLRVYLDSSNGTNNTAANPAPGAITTGEDGAIIFSIVASGAQSWGPSAQSGTIIANTDDGATGGGEQYTIQTTHGTHTASWTNTSDDWGSVVAAFAAVPAVVLQNYMAVDAASGMWVGERIR